MRPAGLLGSLAAVLALGACGGGGGQDEAAPPQDPAAAFRRQASAVCRAEHDAELDLIVHTSGIAAFGAGRTKLVRSEVAQLRAITPPDDLRLDADLFVRRLAAGAGLDVDGKAVAPTSRLDPSKGLLDAQEQAKAFATKLGLPACASSRGAETG